MKRMRNKWCWVVPMVMVGAAAGFAEPFGPPPGESVEPGGEGVRFMGPGPAREMMLMRVAMDPEVCEEAGITAEQSKKIRDGLFELGQQRIAVEKDLQLASMKQAKMMSEDVIDEAAVMAGVTEVSRLRGEIAKLRMQELLLVKKTLSPEQIHKARKMLRERGPEMGRGKGGPEDRDRPGRGHGKNKDKDREASAQEDGPKD